MLTNEEQSLKRCPFLFALGVAFLRESRGHDVHVWRGRVLNRFADYAIHATDISIESVLRELCTRLVLLGLEPYMIITNI